MTPLSNLVYTISAVFIYNERKNIVTALSIAFFFRNHVAPRAQDPNCPTLITPPSHFVKSSDLFLCFKEDLKLHMVTANFGGKNARTHAINDTRMHGVGKALFL